MVTAVYIRVVTVVIYEGCPEKTGDDASAFPVTRLATSQTALLGGRAMQCGVPCQEETRKIKMTSVFSVPNTQVNGGTITEMRNAEGRHRLWRGSTL